MKYFLDTEFNETGGEKRPTIDLISIGIVSETGRDYYAESSEFDAKACNPWVQENVLPKLRGEGKPRQIIMQEIIQFIGDDKPEFWAYYADYDWVVFCWLFGPMVGLPENFPKLCMDLQQWWIQLGRPDVKPPDPPGEHDALIDAYWNKDLWNALNNAATVLEPIL